jgi:hypothetical protein
MIAAPDWLSQFFFQRGLSLWDAGQSTDIAGTIGLVVKISCHSVAQEVYDAEFRFIATPRFEAGGGAKVYITLRELPTLPRKEPYALDTWPERRPKSFSPSRAARALIKSIFR